MSQELDEAELYYSDLRSKLIERAQLIKKIMANPTKLHKIKKNQIVNAIQQEMDNDPGDQPYWVEENQYYNNEAYYMQNQGSIPTLSTGMYLGAGV